MPAFSLLFSIVGVPYTDYTLYPHQEELVTSNLRYVVSERLTAYYPNSLPI
jgi:hypothetical protein